MRTAPDEFCTHCGGRLGKRRVTIVGTDVLLHDYCAPKWLPVKPFAITCSGYDWVLLHGAANHPIPFSTVNDAMQFLCDEHRLRTFYAGEQWTPGQLEQFRRGAHN